MKVSVEVFESQKMGSVLVYANVKDFDKTGKDCCIHEVEADNTKDAKAAAIKEHKEKCMKPELYYIQDTRSHISDCAMFWAIGENGYTTDINKAGLFNKDEAKKICMNRKTDIAWPEWYIRSIMINVVDMQYMDKSKAKWKR
jgi:hypothetical protein